jgi:glycosyltransferase involved in cell wall biosynthesis/Flp pilus assembly protein TadD/ubiquinone/menaquinone biosynthesis C-methylase UbiE
VKNPMRVVHLCSFDHGGAGKAAYRLHKGLQAIGIHSIMYVLDKKTTDPTVKVLAPGTAMGRSRKRWHALLSDYPGRPTGLEIFTDAVAEVRLETVQEIRDADLVNLHWVAGLLDYPSADAALKGKPIVWTLHDMNPFTGGCHYGGNCWRYMDACRACPQLGSTSLDDLANSIWQQKRHAHRSLHIHAVTPSRWLARCARESALFSRIPVDVIPNGLPVDVFKPCPKSEVRKALGIAQSARVVLFGADSIINERKGFKYLLEAISRLSPCDQENEIVLACFGHLPPDVVLESKHPILKLGYISDEEYLAKVYNAADVFVLPSLEDNLPNSVVEAMACGIPVVGFDIGGMPDMIEHHQTGFLAKRKDIDGLLEGIKWVTSSEEVQQNLSKNCREKAAKRYGLLTQAAAYKRVYEAISDRSSHAGDWGKPDRDSCACGESEVESLKALNEAGESLYQKGELDGALAAFRRAIESAPNHATAHNNLGVLFWERGEQGKALEHIVKALEIDANNKDAILNLANMLTVSGKSGDAKQVLLRYLEIHPDDEEIAAAVQRCKQRAGASADQCRVTINDFSSFTYSRKSHFHYFVDNDLTLYGQKIDPLNCDLKVYQDLLLYTFISANLAKGSKILEIGGGNSRVLNALKDEYECWNIDKLEGRGDGPTRVDAKGYRLVKAYMGEFSHELPDRYFDFVFSISALEHVGSEEQTYRNICADIERILKPGGYSLHCFDILVKEGTVWSNGLLPYMFKDYDTINKFVPFEEMTHDADLYSMSERAYARCWEHVTKTPYQAFGKPVSYNILWRKHEETSRDSKGFPNKCENRAFPHRKSPAPRITIVTPSYNQGKFLKKCITSVINQGYPNLEYIVIDGGSTDNSVETIREYEDRLDYWVSEKDEGQAHAINKGLARASGRIFNWLNADDYLEPDALFKVAEAYSLKPDGAGWVGACCIVDQAGSEEGIVFPNGVERDHLGENWNGRVFYQPACFLSTAKVREAGGINANLHYCMDYELYLRLLQRSELFIGEGLWANAIRHPGAKTKGALERSYLETIDVMKQFGFLGGAQNRYERRFGGGRLQYVMPPGLAGQLSGLKREAAHIDRLKQPRSFYDRRHICFAGDFEQTQSLEAVQHFISQIFPRILRRHPGVRLNIFGKGSEKHIPVLETAHVQVIGEVEDLVQVLSHYKLFVCPLLHSRRRHDEFGVAASIGLPIVTTSAGARGYPVKDGQACFVADDDWEFAEKCNHCLGDPPTWGHFSASLQLMMAHMGRTPKAAPERAEGVHRHLAQAEGQPKIVVVQGGFPAVSATFILDQITGLMDRGFEVETWATYNPHEKTVHQDVYRYGLLEKTRYLQLPPQSLVTEPERWVAAFQQLNRIHDIDEVDAFHVHYGPNFNLLQPLFRCLEKFILVSFHGYDVSSHLRTHGNNCYDYLFKRANMITAPSAYIRDVLAARGCSRDRILVHRCGVNLNAFCPGRQKHQQAPTTLLTVARLVEKKGIEYALKAFAELPDRSDLQYRIIGDGPLREELNELVGRLGLQNEVTFLGAQEKARVVEEMANADIFVLTSVTASDGDEEGLPVSLIEAHAMGLPVVSTRHSGIPELVIHGQSGLLAKERDVKGIAENMELLIARRELRGRFSANARKRVQEEFDIALLNDRLSAFMREGIEDQRASAMASTPKIFYSDLYDQLAKKGWAYKSELYMPCFESVRFVREIQAPSISIVVISSTFHPETIQCLEALAGQRVHNCELIFVDNGGRPGEFDGLKPIVDVHVRLNRNTGAYLARNVGAVFAKAPILLFLDDDGIPAPNLVKAHLDAFEKYDVIAVRGAVLPRTNNTLNDLAGHYFLGDRPFPVFADVEGNTSYDAAAFYGVGGWDDEIIFGGGGLDLSRRLLNIEPDMRKQIYSPDCVIYHDYAQDQTHLEGKRGKHEKSRRRLRGKHKDYDAFLESWKRFHQREDLVIVRLYRSICSQGRSAAISIVIPTYNRAEYIREAIQSALAQTHSADDILVVDDGSTDNTPAILAEFPQDKVRYIRKEHEGAPSTRNAGVKEARGEWIVWLDSDDVLLPDALKAHLDKLKQVPDADVFYGDLIITDNHMQPQRAFQYEDWYGRRAELIGRMFKECVIPNGGSMIHKACYDRIGWYDESFLRAHDYQWWTRLLDVAKFKHVGTTIYKWRWHHTNMSSGSVPVVDFSYEARIAVSMLQRYSLEALFPDLNWGDRDRSLGIAFLQIGDLFMQRKDPRRAIHHYLESLSAGKNAVCHNNMGVAYCALTEYQNAIDAFESALKTDPGFEQAKNNLAQLKERLHWLHRQKVKADVRQMHPVEQAPPAKEVLDVTQEPAKAAASAPEYLDMESAQPSMQAAPRESRVLIACDYFWPSIGGVELYVEELGVRLLQAGYAVDVSARWMPGRQSLEHRGLRIHQFRCEGTLSEYGTQQEIEKFRSLVTSGGYHTTIVLTQPDNWVGVGIMDLPKPKPRLILLPSINADNITEWQRTMRIQQVAQTLGVADDLVVVTEAGFDAKLIDASGLKAHFIPHAVSQNAVEGDFRPTHGFSTERPLLMMVANFWPVKNHLALLERLADTRGEWQLAIIGHPVSHLYPYYERVIAEAAKDPRVRVIDGLPPDQAAAAIRDADLLLVPSRGESAGPLVVLQAMSYGTAWIATPECNAARDEAGGIVAPLDAFPGVIQHLLANSDERTELGRLGQDHWRRCFTWDKTLPALMSLIDGERPLPDLRMPDDLRVATEQLRKGFSEEGAAFKGSATEITVIIPTHNRSENLCKCLDALTVQTLPADSFEVIVCDDGSTDETGTVVKGYSAPYRLHYLRQENLGAAAARNRGIKQARGRLLLFINDDTYPVADALEQHVRAHRAAGDERVAVLGHIAFTSEFAERSLSQALTQYNLLFPLVGTREGVPYGFDHFVTGNISVGRDAFIAENVWFDEAFHKCYCEDIEVGYRLWQRGYRVYYNAQARVIHDHRLTVHDFQRRELANGSNLVLFLNKHPELIQHYLGVLALTEEVLAEWSRMVEQNSYPIAQLIDQVASIEDASPAALAGPNAVPSKDAGVVEQVARALMQLSAYLKRKAILQTLDEMPAVREHLLQPADFAQQRPEERRPLVSVVIPCYNYARYLPEAVDSVINQTHQNLEVIIVNDGSTDNTREVAEILIAQNPGRKIRLVDQENSGQPAISRNRGIARAAGEYILCLDADDKIAPTMLERCLSLLESDGWIAIVYTDRQDFDGVDQVVRAGDYDFSQLKYANQISYCALFRREVWERVGGYRTNVKGCEDWDFWVAAGARGYLGRRIPEPLFQYRRHDTGVYQEVLGHYEEKLAQIVLNNREVYRSSDILFAERVLGASADRGAKAGPMVSVVVPTHNRPDMLLDALRSILHQAYQNFEIIVVNDGGQDVRDEINAFQDKRIKCIVHAQNRGLAAARNTGVRNAAGDYIALLDDDDIFYPEHLETAVQFLSADNPVVYTDAVRATFVKQGDADTLAGRSVPYSMDYDRNKLLVGNIAPVNCFVFEKKLALEAGLFDETFSTLEDWEFWIRLSARANFKHIPKKTVQVNWRTDGSTLTSSRQADFQQNRERVYEKYRDDIARIPNLAEIISEFNAIWASDRNPPPKPRVSIIILTHNGLEYTKKCVAALQHSQKEPCEIIFVDNGSNDGSVAYLLQLVRDNPEYRLIVNGENRGFAAGNNQGMAVARGDYIVLLNNDVVVGHGWLERLVACVDRSPRIGIAGPMSNYVSGPQLVREVAYDMTTLEGWPQFVETFAARHAGRARPFWRVVGFCMLIKRAVIEKIGGLDEGFGLGNFEDDDFSMRAALAGFESWIAEDCFVHHFGSRTFVGAQIDYRKSLLKNWEIFKEKWCLPADLPYGAPFDLPGILKRGFHPREHRVPLRSNTGGVNLDAAAIECMNERLREGEAHFEKGRLREAEQAFRDIIASSPQHGRAHNNLACVHWQEGDVEGALREVMRAVKFAPHDPDVIWNCGQILQGLGKAEAAREIFISYLRTHPKDEAMLEVVANR